MSQPHNLGLCRVPFNLYRVCLHISLWASTTGGTPITADGLVAEILKGFGHGSRGSPHSSWKSPIFRTVGALNPLPSNWVIPPLCLLLPPCQGKVPGVLQDGQLFGEA